MLPAMAYLLEAFLAPSSLAAEVAAAVGSVAVPLDREIVLVPLPESGGPEDAAQRMADLSHRGPVAYVEAEYFGGVGEQRATLWRDGVAEDLPALNEALRALGVRRTGGRDEFDTIGLGRHRTTQDWLPPG
jgi:hypothetical protein